MASAKSVTRKESSRFLTSVVKSEMKQRSSFTARQDSAANGREIAPFVKEVGALCRTVVRSVQISLPGWVPSHFDSDEALQLLTRLPNLGKVRIAASVRRIGRLQNELGQGGINEVAVTFEVTVYNIFYHRKRIQSELMA